MIDEIACCDGLVFVVDGGLRVADRSSLLMTEIACHHSPLTAPRDQGSLVIFPSYAMHTVPTPFTIGVHIICTQARPDHNGMTAGWSRPTVLCVSNYSVKIDPYLAQF